MSNVIIYTNDLGGVSICVPAGDTTIEQVQSTDIPEGVISYIVKLSSLPINDMDFFDAFEQVEGIVSININKAKEITKARLRWQREPLLIAQDIEFQRAIETGSDTSSVITEKQRLRDITRQADMCNTTNELRAISVYQ